MDVDSLDAIVERSDEVDDLGIRVDAVALQLHVLAGEAVPGFVEEVVDHCRVGGAIAGDAVPQGLASAPLHSFAMTRGRAPHPIDTQTIVYLRGPLATMRFPGLHAGTCATVNR